MNSARVIPSFCGSTRFHEKSGNIAEQDGLRCAVQTDLRGANAGVILRFPLPDRLVQKVMIGEIKNVARQGLTAQIKDYIAIAQEKRIPFDLYVRQCTSLSGPLQRAVAAGRVNIRRVLP